jgi:hypothetical protein
VGAVPLLPPTARRLVPDRVRHDVRLRAFAVGLGVIPPRAMHSEEEAALLVSLARAARTIVEIGVYEGGSAVQIAREMPRDGELHLIDPFGKQPGALPRDWAATEWATRRTVARAARGGPRVIWHARFSQDAVVGWTTPIDLLFVDGDHLEPGVRRDWDDWHGHVVPGGHVAFHDSREDRPHGRGLPGPTRVVDALFRDGTTPGWTIAHEVDRTTVVRRDAQPAPSSA